MEDKQLETAVEEQYLHKTIDIAKQQLDQAKNAAEEKKLGIAKIKREARENAAHSITNLYDADDFEALAELSQYTNAVNEGILDYEEEKRKISRLELSMVWLLSNIIERCKCLFMGISGVSSFYPAPPKTVKLQKNGVKNGVCLWDMRQEF